jgi:hypothetical protein
MATPIITKLSKSNIFFGLQWHDVHTKFHENQSIGLKVIRGERHTHTHTFWLKYVSDGTHQVAIKGLKDLGKQSRFSVKYAYINEFPWVQK